MFKLHLLAVLNSVWCVAEMELRGTVLVGGALKLQATNLRRLPLPRLSDAELEPSTTRTRRLSARAALAPIGVHLFGYELEGFVLAKALAA